MDISSDLYNVQLKVYDLEELKLQPSTSEIAYTSRQRPAPDKNNGMSGTNAFDDPSNKTVRPNDDGPGLTSYRKNC